METLSNHTNTQVLLTTHWYGSLPTLQNGNLNHIEFDNKPIIKSFSFNNFMEDRRNFPDDIDLKSFFELVTSIISSIKSSGTKWLIIEGADDKIYFEHYLKNKIDNLYILPVGGCGNVIKIYEYLYAPFSEKTEKGILKDSKVLCLIDSDRNQKTTKFPDLSNNSLKIVRLQANKSNYSLSTLVNVGEYDNTVIEDCLKPDIMFKAIEKTIVDENNIEVMELFSNFSYRTDAESSKIDIDKSILKPNDVNALEQKEELINKIKDNSFKIRLSQNYVNLDVIDNDIPKIFNLVESYFNK